MHSTIECAKKNTSVFSLSGRKAIIEMARRRRPYKVKQMDFPDFVDCKALSSSLIKNHSKDEHGAQVNWLKIKVLRFEKSVDDCIQYKYRYDDAFTKIFVKQI